MKHEKHPLQLRAEAHLARAGGFYSFADIISAIDEGRMQSFAEGESWAVTQIIDFPRRRMVDVVLLVGNKKDFAALTKQVEDFAVRQGIDCIHGTPRKGFGNDTYRPEGWKLVGVCIMRELK